MEKIRKVSIMLEVETSANLRSLREKAMYSYNGTGFFRLAQKPKVTVVQPIKKGG